MNQRLPLTRHLGFRLGVALCVGAVLIWGATSSWNLGLQREHMTNLVKVSADRSVEIIRRSTREAMMENRPEEVQRLIETIGAQPGIQSIRIFDRAGRIRSSTAPDEIGRATDKQAESCVECHRNEEAIRELPLTGRSRIFTQDGARFLGIVATIRNEPDCATAACHAHPPDEQVLGVLDVQLSLATVDAHMVASERQLALGLLLTAGAILVLGGYLVWRLVIRPVGALRSATEQVTAGDLTTHVPVQSTDELGGLAASWNAMVDELGRARRDLEAWSLTLEERVRQKTEQLEAAHKKVVVSAKMASLGKLAAVVAHEINNPLAGIHTYARLLKKKLAKGAVAPPADVVEALDLVATEAARCGDIVRNLLLFSRQTGARFAEEDLRALFDRCVLLVKHKAELQGVEITVEADALPPVHCDASQVQQLVLALAMNALEAMPEGGTLTIAARPDGEEIEIRVADTGCGIPAEDLEHVFEPFYTKKEEGKGVGLGLAVVYGIVRRHRGRIEVDSTPGRGTTFVVRLPVNQPQAAAQPEEVAP